MLKNIFETNLWYEIFPGLCNMTITASVVILFVLLARLFLRRAPKVFSYALWAVVLFRLLCPVSLEGGFSLLRFVDAPTVRTDSGGTVAEYIPPDIVHTENPAVTLPVPGAGEAINDALPQGREQLAADPLEAPTSILTYIWLAGLLCLAVWGCANYFRLLPRLRERVRLRDNIFLADGIASPFVTGLVRPKIYLPSSLGGDEREYIILHEQHHIRRLDHVFKLLAYAALCAHWFNPLVWLAFALSSRDMEMSCDEAVMKKTGGRVRADYSASLLNLATGRRIFAAAPLAFGEGSAKSRVKNLALWKMPRVWVTVASVALCLAVTAACALNPAADDGGNDSNFNPYFNAVIVEVTDGELTVAPFPDEDILEQNGIFVLSRETHSDNNIADPEAGDSIRIVYNGRIEDEEPIPRLGVVFGIYPLGEVESESEILAHLYSFEATVLDTSGEGVLVEPITTDAVIGSCDRVIVSTYPFSSGYDFPFVSEGSVVTVYHFGAANSTYPLQLKNIYAVFAEPGADVSGPAPAPSGGPDPLPAKETPEAQLRLIAESRELWVSEADFANDMYGCAVTDLDLNGRLEVIFANVGGTGIHTYADIFEVSADYETLVKLESPFDEFTSWPDIIYETQVNVRFDAETGRIHYLFNDSYKNGAAEYGTTGYALCLHGGVLEKVFIWSERTTHTEEGEQTVVADGRPEAMEILGMQRGTAALGWVAESGRILPEELLGMEPELLYDKLLNSYHSFSVGVS